MTGTSFIKAMIMGNLGDANCSLESMCCLLDEDKINMTKQGLNFRFSPAAVEFMGKMFKEALTIFNNKL
jgi:hypothetical protein